MSNCYECANFSRAPRGEEMCRLHGFYPGKPHTMPRNCRDYVRWWPPRPATKEEVGSGVKDIRVVCNKGRESQAEWSEE